MDPYAVSVVFPFNRGQRYTIYLDRVPAVGEILRIRHPTPVSAMDGTQWWQVKYVVWNPAMVSTSHAEILLSPIEEPYGMTWV